jgi:hypothetical protein
MSDEFDHGSEHTYSTFWPLLIMVGGLLLWFAYQDYTVNKQRAFYKDQVEGAAKTIQTARDWQGRYEAILKDLNATGAHDPTSAAIFKDAVQAGLQAGLIHVQPPADAGSGTAPATK